MIYRISYTIKTTSRCGAYCYNSTKLIESENKEEAKRKIIEALKNDSGYGFKRYKIIIKNIIEV